MKPRFRWSDASCYCHDDPGASITPVFPPAPTMKTPTLHPFQASHLILLCALSLSFPAFARDRVRIPPPPPPDKVVNDIRVFFHRLALGVKDASKQTWGAIRERFSEEDQPQQNRSGRSASRNRSGDPSADAQSFARSKDAVPYRYDDADPFDTRMKSDPAADGLPRVNIAPRDTGKNGPYASPGEQAKPLPPANHKPLLAPDPGSNATQSVPLPDSSLSTPKATTPAGDTNLEFARPVPGRRGLVFPPGLKDSPENMVDVGGFQTGQIVRDPRTGKLFRVP